MCTLILGVEVVEPRSILLAANRDEDPARPTDPPAVLDPGPPLAGGRDRVAGGTWLAVGRSAVVALLNRRPRGPGPPGARSRGLLTLDVAAATSGDGTPWIARAADRLRAALGRDAYAPFSLLAATRESCWLAVHEPGAPLRLAPVGAGWHVVTHADLDDPAEPRTAGLVADLANWQPPTLHRAIEGLVSRLALHDGGRPPVPAVCLHQGPMVTVSSSLVWLGASGPRYLHAEGRPCSAPWTDHGALLTAGEHAA